MKVSESLYDNNLDLRYDIEKHEKEKQKYANLLNTDDSLLKMGERLRKYRIKAGYTILRLSKEVDVACNTITGLECNNLIVASYENATKIAQVLNIDVSLISLTKEERQKVKFANLLETDDALLSVGQCIKKYRIKESFTMSNFAKEIDLPVTCISSLEKSCSFLSLEKAKIAAKLLKVDISLIYLSKADKQKLKYANLLKKSDEELSRGEIIKKYRILNNYTLDTFAEKVGLDYSYMTKIEDNTNMLSYEKAIVFAKLLNLDPNMISLTEEGRQKMKFAILLETDDTLLNVGERIKKYRIINNYTLNTFSKKVDIANTHLCNIENNKSNATNKLLHDFAAALNIDKSVLSGTEDVIIKEEETSNTKHIEKKIQRLQENNAKLLQTDDSLLERGMLIRKYRILKGISSREFSEKLDISSPHLNQIENGKCNLSKKCAKKISPILDLELSLLLKPEYNMSTKNVYPIKVNNSSSCIKERKEKRQALLDADDTTLTIGEIIKKYRMKKKYSIKVVARKVDITYQYLGDIERDKLMASFNKMKTIAQVLDIDVSLICMNEQEKEQQHYSELLLMDDEMLSIGKRIKKYRIKNGYTIKTFSDICKIAHSHLREIEKDCNMASLKLTKRMANILNIDYKTIYISDEEAAQKKASYISKITEKKLEKYSYLIESDDELLSAGECIRKYRLKNNYTIKELSEMLGIGLASLNSYELDKRRFKKNIALKAAEIFKIDVSLIYR